LPGAAVSRVKRLGGLWGFAGSGSWAAAAVSLAGSVARFWDLGARSWSFDEALGLFPAARPDLSSVISSPPWVAFPFFHVILHYWMLAGSGEAWGRALPALLSSVSLFFAWGILKRIMPRPAALGALALFAFSPFQVLLAQDVRPYGIVLAAQLGAFLVLLSALERPALMKWALWSLLLAVAALAHIVAALWIPAQILFLALFRRGRRMLAPSLCWGTAALAPAAFAAYWMRGAIAHVNAASQLTDPVDYLHGILQIYGVSSFVPSAFYSPGMAAFGGLAVLGGWRLIRRDRKKGLGLPGATLIACGLFPLIGLLLANWTGFLYMPKPR